MRLADAKIVLSLPEFDEATNIAITPATERPHCAITMPADVKDICSAASASRQRRAFSALTTAASQLLPLSADDGGDAIYFHFDFPDSHCRRGLHMLAIDDFALLTPTR